MKANKEKSGDNIYNNAVEMSLMGYHIDERIPSLLNDERRSIQIHAFVKKHCSINIHFGELICNLISKYLSNKIEEGMFITKSDYFDINCLHIHNMIEPNDTTIFAQKLTTAAPQRQITWCYCVLIGTLMFIVDTILCVMIGTLKLYDFLWTMFYSISIMCTSIGIFGYFYKPKSVSNPLCSLLKFNIEEQLIQEWIVQSYDMHQYGSIIVNEEEEKGGKYVCKLSKIINHCSFQNLRKVYCKSPQKIHHGNGKKMEYIDGYIRFIPKNPNEPTTVITKYRPHILYETEITSQLNRLNINNVYVNTV